MRRPILALAAIATFAGAQPPGPQKAPGKSKETAASFADFRVPAPLAPRKGRADFVTPERFPGWERLLPALAKEGPDFAGYYTVAQWSCGSLCNGFGILDVRTAALHRVQFNVSVRCPDYKPGSGSELIYRVDSRLLIVNGAIEFPSGEQRGPCGKSYFEWDGMELRPVPAASGNRAVPRAN